MGDLRRLWLEAVEAHTVADSISVRQIELSDRDALADLYLMSYPPEVGAETVVASRQEIDSTFAGEFGVLRRDASLIAFIAGEPAGAVLTVERSIWDEGLTGPFVIDLFVSPAHRRKGAGRALMHGAIAAAKAAGDESIGLRVGDGTSASAHRLYEDLGFESIVA